MEETLQHEPSQGGGARALSYEEQPAQHKIHVIDVKEATATSEAAQATYGSSSPDPRSLQPNFKM